MTDCTVGAPVRATKAGARPSKGAQNPKPTPPMRCVTDGPAEPATSHAPIVLTLRPNGKSFNGNRVERAQEAGFNWLRNAHAIGFASEDTGEEIARFVVDGASEAMGTLGEIQLHIDPSNCALDWRAGKRAIEMTQHYCVLIGGYVADGFGVRLDDAALAAVADHVDSVIEQRRSAAKQARIVTLTSGERRELSKLSFAYTVLREAGSKKSIYRGVYFDAPALDYHEGRALGMQMAGEIVEFFRKHKTSKPDLNHILREAINRGGRFGNYEKADVANAAAGFMLVMETLIEVGARHLNPKWLEFKIAEEKRRHEVWLTAREARKAEFVARMKAGRLAKKTGGKP